MEQISGPEPIKFMMMMLMYSPATKPFKFMFLINLIKYRFIVRIIPDAKK